MSSVRWYIEGHMWLCPNCHQGSYYASGDADGKSSLECLNCGWVHMRGFWCQVKCPEGCLFLQPSGVFEKRSYVRSGWDKVILGSEVIWRQGIVEVEDEEIL